jgi:hypothetical protein
MFTFVGQEQQPYAQATPIHLPHTSILTCDSTKRSVLSEVLHALHAKVKTTRNFATSVFSRTVIATQSFDGNRQGRNWMQLQRQLQ